MTENPKRFLIISHNHLLIPLAHRLRSEGNVVELLNWNKRYERSWDDSFDRVIKAKRGAITQESLAPVIELADAGEITIVTDVRDAVKFFGNATSYFGSLGFPEAPRAALRLGGWFDGEQVWAQHAMVCDVGVQVGGMGALEDGGVTLMRLDGANLKLYDEILAPVLDELKSLAFRGLFQVGLEPDSKAQLQLKGIRAGWPFLHTQAFFSDVGDSETGVTLGDVLAGQPPDLAYRFTTAIPVSQPPWPYRKGVAEKDVLIDGLTPKQQQDVFWHDVRLDKEAREIRTAGLDGLVGVAHGSANTHSLSLGKAMSIAQRMSFPEKQFRADAGGSVQVMMGSLEQMLGLTL